MTSQEPHKDEQAGWSRRPCWTEVAAGSLEVSFQMFSGLTPSFPFPGVGGDRADLRHFIQQDQVGSTPAMRK